ncbi:hypothetical protein ACFL6R_05520 [Gemmatimonadota bacterium]
MQKERSNQPFTFVVGFICLAGFLMTTGCGSGISEPGDIWCPSKQRYVKRIEDCPELLDGGEWYGSPPFFRAVNDGNTHEIEMFLREGETKANTYFIWLMKGGIPVPIGRNHMAITIGNTDVVEWLPHRRHGNSGQLIVRGTEDESTTISIELIKPWRLFSGKKSLELIETFTLTIKAKDAVQPIPPER